MKAALRQLLWFVIPTAANALLLYIIIFSRLGGNLPKFYSNQEYLRLFLKDPLVYRAFVNTFLFWLLTCLPIVAVFYILKICAARAFKAGWVTPAVYSLLFVCAAFIFYGITGLPVLMGMPPVRYAAHAIVSVPKLSVNIPAVLIAAQAGLSVCFVFWLIDKAVTVVGKRKAGQTVKTSS